jgi:hypothetical protein
MQCKAALQSIIITLLLSACNPAEVALIETATEDAVQIERNVFNPQALPDPQPATIIIKPNPPPQAP